jgi:hypothetical protein
MNHGLREINSDILSYVQELAWRASEKSTVGIFQNTSERRWLSKFGIPFFCVN